MVLIIVSLIIFTTYLIWIISKYGLLPSISDSYYKLKEDKLDFVFTLFIWYVSLSTIFIASTPLMFGAGSLIAFVGAATAFKDDNLTKKVHTISAISGILFGIMSLLLEFNDYIFPVIFLNLFLIIVISNPKNKIYWVEIVAFYSIYFSLLINKL